MNENDSILHFKFDVSTFRLLGRELISDRITALFELVKNCYDANANTVTITFKDVNPRSLYGCIIIEDDGLGMTYEDLRDKWMVIGTASKRRNQKSPAPYNRVVAGKKGVGRFAVDKLGAKLVLKTKKMQSAYWECLQTDWSEYEKEEKRQLELDFDSTNEKKKLFTDIDNAYWTEPAPINQQGTRLEISNLSDVWTEADIQRVCKELSKIVRAKQVCNYPFNIVVQAPLYKGYEHFIVKSADLIQATLSFTLDYRYDDVTGKYYQKYLKTEGEKIQIQEKEAEIFGPIVLTLLYYDKLGKSRFKSADSPSQIDGVKVYRDGLIATPFAEYKSNRDEQKDLFGIDKRQWSGFFDKLSTRDLLGWVDLTTSLNPEIKDSTNRQDFVANAEWDALKHFVIEQITQIEKYLKRTREKQKEDNAMRLQKADRELEDIKKKVQHIKRHALLANPEMDSDIQNITDKLAAIKESIADSSANYEQLKQEHRQQENILFSLVSLQIYAGMISHIVRTSLGFIRRSAELVMDWAGIAGRESACQKHAKRISTEMKSLSKAMDFMLGYAQDDSTFSPFNVKKVLTDIFENRYAELFDINDIVPELFIDEAFDLVYNQKAFEDMFGNLISNSIKALRNQTNKHIKCDVSRQDDNLVILFSDNGLGVAEENKDKIFDVFFTTTADEGGAGLGLYIVSTRLEAIHGSISLIEPEYKPTGATFKIIIPLTINNIEL